MPVIVFAGPDDLVPAWRAALAQAAPEWTISAPGDADPGDVEYLLYAPDGPVKDLAPYAGAKAIISLWAGVEALLANPTLPPHTPVTRMVEPGLTQGMTEYVLGHVLRTHLDMAFQQAAQARKEWAWAPPPLASQRRVTLFGLGELGADAARALTQIGFQTAGWSRTPKQIDSVETFSGEDGFHVALEQTDIAVILLPLTPQTRGLFDAQAFARMPQGAHVINPGRGPIIDDNALLAALEGGQIASATLDVFAVEPLPPSHPYWTTPGVTVTPHVASVTRPETAAGAAADQIRRSLAGEPLRNLLDRAQGY